MSDEIEQTNKIVDETTKQEHVVEQINDKIVVVGNKEEEEINRQISELQAKIKLESKRKILKNLERELTEVQEPEISTSEPVKISKPLTVYEATKKTVNQQKIGNNKDHLLQIPMEELLQILGIADEDITGLEDGLLYNVCDELSGGNNRLIVRVKAYKNKLIAQKEQEKQRLIREEQIEHQRKLEEQKLKEEQAKTAKEEQIRRTYNPCPYCRQRTVNKKALIKNEQTQCENPLCNKIVNYCPKCISIVDDEHVHPEDLLALLEYQEKYQQQKEQERQKEILKQQEEIRKQQTKEQLLKQPIKYGPPKSDTILDTKFFQSALSNVPDTIEALRKAIGEQGTERLVNALVSKVKKE